MKAIDNFLNNITMYRLMLYGLTALALISFVLSLLGLIAYSPLQLVVSLAVLVFVAYVANAVFAKLWRVPTNVESVYITAFILFFVLAPSVQTTDILLLALAAAIAMASKYILTIGKKHIFNPVAISAVILGAFGSGIAVWWVATPYLALFVAILVLLIVRKIRRFYLFATFFIIALAGVVASQFTSPGQALGMIQEVILSWPILFFGGIMLTEPLTTPPTQNLQIAYGAIVGVLFAAQFHFGPIYSTPELALVLGNIFAYIVSSKQKLKLSFVGSQKLSSNVYDFAFLPDKKLNFKPGQYLEWTFAYDKPDTRGNRRYFTIASSPTEKEIHLGVRIDGAQSSSFKKNLLALKPGDSAMAGSLSGEFTLPQDKNKKLVWIAGGIGITPFRSQLKYLYDTGEHRDITLIYACAGTGDFTYHDEIEAMKSAVGLKTLYICTVADDPVWRGKTGYLTPELLRGEIGDYADRAFYLSGPNAMVKNYKKMLLGMNIPSRNIHTDYFPGF